MAQMGESEFNTFLDLHLDDLPLTIFDHDHQTQKLPDPARSTPHSAQPMQSLTMSAEESMAHSQQLFDFTLPLEHQFTLPPQPNSLPAHYATPPTPNSIEMHPDHAQYMQHLEAQQRALIEYQIKRQEAASFTPSTSPMVHAGDISYDVNAFHATQDNYFSPLTSPALEGQNYPYQHTSASSVATASPVDQDIEMADSSMHRTSRVGARSKKRPITSQADIAPPRLPTAKAKTHRARKNNISTSALERPPSVTIKSSPSMDTWAPSRHTPQLHHISPNDSVSPEPLDVAMPPPKFPASASNSPAIVAKSKQPKGVRQGPATPASLMKMAKSRGAQKATAIPSPADPPPLTIDPSLPPLALPEAATTSPLTPDISPAGLSGSRKTPKLGPLSTPGTAALTKTASDSTLNSPLSGSFSNPRKADPKPRNKKRGSILNSALVSPALRPKISPSIKPLLPEGVAGSEDAHTIFLASRSNYQNLIEGTHVPGVEYPRELSTNLTSKRTSHKIAEQGRRNRINLALQEMLRLLPKAALVGGAGSASAASPAREADDSASPAELPCGSGNEDAGSSATAKATPQKRSSGSGSADAAALAGSAAAKASGNSKAATVESAIEYIKSLQAESAAMNERAARREREVEALRLRVREMERLCGERGVSVGADGEAEDGADDERETKE